MTNATVEFEVDTEINCVLEIIRCVKSEDWSQDLGGKRIFISY